METNQIKPTAQPSLSPQENMLCKKPAAYFDYSRKEPVIIEETDNWAVVFKPAHLPSAPLRAGESGTAVYWFLHTAGEKAARVYGKKPIEAGLLHRLDTETRGVLLFAKNQYTYDSFSKQQQSGMMLKTYYAFTEKQNTKKQTVPYSICSQFRNFGPKAKRTAAVFPRSRHYRNNGKLYTTYIEEIKPYSFKSSHQPEKKYSRIRCCLTQGYRHQVRVHLASSGMPIIGDPLYTSSESREEKASSASNTNSIPVPLQLYAVSISFTDPDSCCHICVALPPPDKMSR